MKRTLGTSMLLVFAVFGVLIIPISAQDDAYSDPVGRYTLTIPTQWTLTETDAGVTLTDPDAALAVHIVVAPADEDLADTIANAWLTVDPAFAGVIDQTAEVPSAAGIDQTVTVAYEVDPDTLFVYQAIAQRLGDTAYLLLFSGNLDVAQRRSSQLGIIQTGFIITALEQIDLSTTQPAVIDDAITQQLADYTQRTLERAGIPGAVVAIVQGGEVVYSQGFGVRVAGGTDPITPDTHMMIGSTGKSLTTLMMATLVDQGLMTWDTPVIDILPSFAVADPELTRTLTLRNLMCACTGVPRRDAELTFSGASTTAEQIVESLASFEFFTDFGEAFQYSNQMVGTGGYVAAMAAGATYGDLFTGYADALQQNVLDPIGMINTTLSFDEVIARGEYAQPHSPSYDADGAYAPISLDIERGLVPIAPAGSHWSTADDMARYLITELQAGVAPDGTRVVSAENLNVTWTPQVPVDATTSYGLGWFINDFYGQTLIEHGGNTLGFTSDFAFLPQSETGILVLTNGRATNAFNSSVRSRLFELIFGLEARTETQFTFAMDENDRFTAESLARAQTVIDETLVAPLVGAYRNEGLGTLTLTLSDGVFTASAPGFTTRLLPETDDTGEISGYVMIDAPATGTVIVFGEDEAGKPIISVGEGALGYVFSEIE